MPDKAAAGRPMEPTEPMERRGGSEPGRESEARGEGFGGTREGGEGFGTSEGAEGSRAPEGVPVRSASGAREDVLPSGQGAAAREGAGGIGATGGAGGPGGRLMSRDEGDKWTLRLQHAVAGFVDGPRESVEEADQVLQEVTERFSDAVTQRRRTLRTSWQTAGDDKADTEQLRLVLRDYRELAERMLRM
ncbi:hypothetical protein [Streptomyces sp. 2A115]|uniref:hypothetical protein n=1 Tax=Streptomyces sp. 2A115 TaxID=3457439 RepID=UPI003FD5D0D1